MLSGPRQTVTAMLRSRQVAVRFYRMLPRVACGGDGSHAAAALAGGDVSARYAMPFAYRLGFYFKPGSVGLLCKSKPAPNPGSARTGIKGKGLSGGLPRPLVRRGISSDDGGPVMGRRRQMEKNHGTDGV